jgi:hypothetical protein
MHDYIITFHFSDDAVGKEFPFGISGYWALFLLVGRGKIKLDGSVRLTAHHYLLPRLRITGG